ncbi:hypothetical protein AVEN_203917-1 [Araneus ventricosus]|uniref:Uncharacterized protein n=1 Tax=Araneus ventricosus TaxID=182803 RepID=A0A4Y2PV71_ARAVE|nr:hypothetical protein AVEN_203917-1 [Araneus ventricosus]
MPHSRSGLLAGPQIWEKNVIGWSLGSIEIPPCFRTLYTLNLFRFNCHQSGEMWKLGECEGENELLPPLTLGIQDIIGAFEELIRGSGRYGLRLSVT